MKIWKLKKYIVQFFLQDPFIAPRSLETRKSDHVCEIAFFFFISHCMKEQKLSNHLYVSHSKQIQGTAKKKIPAEGWANIGFVGTNEKKYNKNIHHC